MAILQKQLLCKPSKLCLTVNNIQCPCFWTSVSVAVWNTNLYDHFLLVFLFRSKSCRWSIWGFGWSTLFGYSCVLQAIYSMETNHYPFDAPFPHFLKNFEPCNEQRGYGWVYWLIRVFCLHNCHSYCNSTLFFWDFEQTFTILYIQNPQQYRPPNSIQYHVLTK